MLQEVDDLTNTPLNFSDEKSAVVRRCLLAFFGVFCF